MWAPPRPLLNCAKLIGTSRHIFYANATVLSTQGPSREAGGGLMGLDALLGGAEMKMGWMRGMDGASAFSIMQLGAAVSYNFKWSVFSGVGVGSTSGP